MACNLYVPRTVDVKNSDTLSEVSESGTSTSDFNSNWGSREDLRDFVLKHGLKDISELYQDRFKVDRKKLEEMLSGANDALIPADVFFAKVMEDTNTYITWPNKLKLGAKSKKDPHVRIAGRQQDVEAAKERIMTILYTRCNRVTMKMDISYTDHSHIIGRGGLSIKRVMEETHCHVHFPDSNRSNPLEKSNQVSISGDLEAVESARGRVRELIPLIFGFEPPILQHKIDATNPYIVKIQEQYKVQVMFKTRSKLHATIVLVKGVEWEVEQVKRATLLLMEYICEHLADQTPVQMSIQISPQHHPIVLGKNHSNLKAIMQFTNTQIMFPDAKDENIPILKKSHINITGNIHNVYTARQLLMGSLPLVIMFDLPENSSILRIKPEQLNEVQTLCDVTISIRQKTKQMLKACIIKGIERYTTSIYRARNLILGIDCPPLNADIPKSYQFPVASPANLQSPATSTNADNNSIKSNTSPSLAKPVFTWQYPPGMMCSAPMASSKPSSQFSFNAMQQSSGSSGFHSFGQFSTHSPDKNNSLISSISSNNSSMSSNMSPNSKASTSTQTYSSTLEDRTNRTPVMQDGAGIKQEKLLMSGTDYENMRLAGLKAMQTPPNPGVYRFPNNCWSGFGLSQTCPERISLDKKNKSDGIWYGPLQGASTQTYSNPSNSRLNTSNIVDHTPTHIVNIITSTNWSDLPSLLCALQLDRYIGLFIKQEVDLATFAMLTDEDLMMLGVTAYGSRKKMLVAISEIKKRTRSFSVAPGAERKGAPFPQGPSDNSHNSRAKW